MEQPNITFEGFQQFIKNMEEMERQEFDEIENRVRQHIGIIKDDEFYPSDDNSNGKFAPRTPEMMRNSAAKAAASTMERYKRAAEILEQNKKEMEGLQCGITDGDSDRKREAIKKYLNDNRSN